MSAAVPLPDPSARWQDTAACKGHTVVYYPEVKPGISAPQAHHKAAAAAVAICATCPHTGIGGPCYQDWAADGDNTAVRFGHTVNQLKRLRTGTPRAEAQALMPPSRRPSRIGLTGEIIRHLERTGPVRARTISSALNANQKSVYMILDRLVNNGTVRRCSGYPATFELAYREPT